MYLLRKTISQLPTSWQPLPWQSEKKGCGVPSFHKVNTDHMMFCLHMTYSAYICDDSAVLRLD